MKATCQKCKKSKDCISLRISKVQDSLCPNCFNEWIDEKDKVITKAYEQWIKKK